MATIVPRFVHKSSSSATATLLGVLALSTPALAGIHIVDATGAGDFATLGAAVAASSSGDVLLVRSGTYVGCTINAKSLSIFADAGANVVVNGPITVSNLGTSQTAAISGLEVDGPTSAYGSFPALMLSSDQGHVRVQNCTLRGGNGLYGYGNPWNPGANGVEITQCFDVALVRCVVRGGDGYGTTPGNGLFDFGGKGGDGVRARFGAVALYDCAITGGQGGGGDGAGGNGGRGYDHDQGGGGALFSACTISGGHGGQAWGYGIGGTGGDALFASSAGHHHLLGGSVSAGAGGASAGYPTASNGTQYAGSGTYELLAGSARSLAASALVADGGVLHVSFTGVAGDRLYLAQSERTRFAFNTQLEGVWLVPFPAPISSTPLAVLSVSGTVVVDIPMSTLASGSNSGLLYAQGLIFEAGGQRVLGSPLITLRLRCNALTPDCDGNGSFDTCDILANPALDATHNGIPDACEPDCNGNGIPDSVDIASGTSTDLNLNGIPDSCEPVRTIHVDAAAPLFGDGSAAAPFNTLHEGIFAALSGDTVLVEDGTYTGESNRDQSFASRSITLTSAHGSAACILDCQALGRAFALHNGESPDTKIKGFTIRNGQPGPASYAGLGGGGAIAVINSGLRIENCVFDTCYAPQGGGAVDLQNVTVGIDTCTFLNNGQLTTYSAGGAVRANGGSLMVQNSLFEQNHGSAGGALLSASPGYSFVERCIFRGNSAQVYGGAVVFQSPATLHDCLIIGNSAPSGGGIALKAGNELVQCTIINNTATLTAGGVYAAYSNVGGGAALALNDSVIWGNSAPSGAQIGSVSFFDIVRLHSCDVAGGAGGVSIGGGTLDYDASNIAVDPQFADVNGRLGPLSPCIDAGDNTLVPADILDLDGDSNTSEPVPFDLDGRARFYDSPTVTDTGVGPAPICDIGAYEWQP